MPTAANEHPPAQGAHLIKATVRMQRARKEDHILYTSCMPTRSREYTTNPYLRSVERECRSRLRLARYYRIAPYQAFALRHLSEERAMLLLSESPKG